MLVVHDLCHQALPSVDVGVSSGLVHRQAPLLVQAAQFKDGAHDAGVLLRRRERAPHELRHLLQVAHRVLQHLLVPEEQHAPWRPLARLPVLADVLPLRAQPAVALAVELEHLLEGGSCRRRCRALAAFYGRPRRPQARIEMPRGDQRVLGVSGDVHDPAPAAVRRRSSREQGVGHVRAEETRRRRRRRRAAVVVAFYG